MYIITKISIAVTSKNESFWKKIADIATYQKIINIWFKNLICFIKQIKQPTVKYYPRWQPIIGLTVHCKLGIARFEPGTQLFCLVLLSVSHRYSSTKILYSQNLPVSSDFLVHPKLSIGPVCLIHTYMKGLSGMA